MAGLTFLTFLAAWQRLLQDARANEFRLTSLDSASCVVGAGVQVVNGVVGCGTLSVRRDKINVPGAYAAIQLHPPHAHARGSATQLWRFHVRAVGQLREDPPADDTSNVFMIYEKGWEGKCKYVQVLSNDSLVGCAKHYFIDPTATKKTKGPPGDSAEFVHHVRHYANALCIKVAVGDHETRLYTRVRRKMNVLAAQFKLRFLPKRALGEATHPSCPPCPRPSKCSSSTRLSIESIVPTVACGFDLALKLVLDDFSEILEELLELITESHKKRKRVFLHQYTPFTASKRNAKRWPSRHDVVKHFATSRNCSVKAEYVEDIVLRSCTDQHLGMLYKHLRALRSVSKKLQKGSPSFTTFRVRFDRVTRLLTQMGEYLSEDAEILLSTLVTASPIPLCHYMSLRV
ncbi:hypothetical protein Poli38472_004620 [Pythium oligandrum]|uniref:Uncharacterized protein n=1 Tax=Pythium oligandrum TaxID=41045 RepID=A0A8K1FEL4_PYTOL|nr:hypothetical protein Poli38472_004620 [Pythium oligandrum]|eukprot:TMW59551.1 hypothetical protein Poli38472_004620 [Pythium oligandrum]